MPLIAGIAINGFALPVFHLGVTQNITYNASGGASAQSTAFQNTGTAVTEAIMISIPANATSGDVRVATGTNPTATGTSALLPAKGVYVFHINPGDKLAVVSNDAGTGAITVTELLSLPPHSFGN